MITKALYDKLYYIATLTKFTNVDAKELQAAIQQTINPKYSVCLRCIQQLKHGQKIILNYLSSVEVIETIMESMQLVEPEITTDFNIEIEVDEVEADKVGCTKCKKKTNELKK